jgi:hypothetical protein
MVAKKVHAGLRGVYPFQAESLAAHIEFGKDKEFGSPEEVITTVARMVDDLEQKLSKVNDLASGA